MMSCLQDKEGAQCSVLKLILHGHFKLAQIATIEIVFEVIFYQVAIAIK